MQLQQIHYYLAICEERSFTRAAKKCGVRQPSLSGAIRRLESTIGGDVFIRSSPVRLTPLGAALLPIFREMSELSASARSVAAAYSRGRTSEPAENVMFRVPHENPLPLAEREPNWSHS